MNEIKTIMVALALGDYSQEIFTYAAGLAERLDAGLIAASIINSRDVEAVGKIVSLGYDVDGEHYVRGIREERAAILERIVRSSTFPAERLRTIFRVGNPAEELLTLSLEENVDMIVMGIKGRSDLESFLVGSAAEKMFRRSPVTIVSYRSEAHRERLRQRIRRL